MLHSFLRLARTMWNGETVSLSRSWISSPGISIQLGSMGSSSGHLVLQSSHVVRAVNLTRATIACSVHGRRIASATALPINGLTGRYARTCRPGA